MKRITSAFAAVKAHFTRPITTKNVLVDPHDVVNIYRTLDKTVLEYVNIVCGTKYWHVHPALAVIQGLQLTGLFLCCGFSERIKVTWPHKQILLMFALPFWYLMDLIKQPFVLPEKHYIVKAKGLEIIGRLSRMRATYSLELNGEQLFSSSVGDYFSRYGEFLLENFEKSALAAAYKAAEILRRE